MTLLSKASFLVTPNGYKEDKLYAAIPTNGNGDMTFTRATTATRVDENDLVSSVASNVPRIDYTGGGCPSILLEPTRRNLFFNSEDFTNASWNKTRTTITGNQATAPDGSNNADLLTGDGTGGSYVFDGVFMYSATYYISIFVKNINGNNFTIQNFSQSGTAIFDLTNGTVTSTSGSMSDAKIVQNPNNWYRVSAKITSTLGGANANVGFGLKNYSGDQFYIWGAQIEDNALGGSVGYLTSYIPTAGSAVTRNADVINRNDIYTNNLIVGGGGTWFVHLINNTAFTNDANGNLFLDTASGGITNGINIRSIGTVARLYINFYTSGFSTFQYLTTTDTVKLVIKWNGATADVFENGAKVVSATIFTPTAMENLGGNGSDQPKYIKQMALFAKPLTDAECIALTTL
jgi:hypothetical protein